MGKIKSFFTNTSLKKSFASYITVCLLIAILVSLISSGLCQLGQNKISNRHRQLFEQTYGKQGYIVTNDDLKLGESITVYTESIINLFSPMEKIIYNVLGAFSVILTPICFVICIAITSILFYNRELQEPLKILDNAADNISKNNLDFTINYKKHNEMGKLCNSFDDMCFALRKNNSEMWRQMEERKILNAAFAHDLRTPLTVLKGYNDILYKYIPEGKITQQKIIETAAIMSDHIERLENYVNAMSKLQKLEDIEIQRVYLETMPFIQKLIDTAIIVCDKINVSSTNNCSLVNLHLDEHIVLEVYDNLLSNIIRYAKNNVAITFHLENDSFIITISDDGCGFNKNSLDKATKPFFKEKENVYDNHFGIGLNICKILCEKHNGNIILSNNINGGACVSVTFSMN